MAQLGGSDEEAALEEEGEEELGEEGEDDARYR